METGPHTLTHHLSPLTTREIEFLKKETAQRRVLEESELARKEEMDKLLDKVGPGCPGAGPGGADSREAPIWRPLWVSVVLLAESSVPGPHQWTQGVGPVPDPLSPLFSRSQNWKETCKH